MGKMELKDIYVADSLDAKAQKVLQKGGKVLVLAAGKVKMGEDVKQTYLPVFWNTSWLRCGRLIPRVLLSTRLIRSSEISLRMIGQI